MCRLCCRDKCYTEDVPCVGHRHKLEVVRRKTAADKNVADSESAMNVVDVECV